MTLKYGKVNVLHYTTQKICLLPYFMRNNRQNLYYESFEWETRDFYIISNKKSENETSKVSYIIYSSQSTNTTSNTHIYKQPISLYSYSYSSTTYQGQALNVIGRRLHILILFCSDKLRNPYYHYVYCIPMRTYFSDIL